MYGRNYNHITRGAYDVVCANYDLLIPRFNAKQSDKINQEKETFETRLLQKKTKKRNLSRRGVKIFKLKLKKRFVIFL